MKTTNKKERVIVRELGTTKEILATLVYDSPNNEMELICHDGVALEEGSLPLQGHEVLYHLDRPVDLNRRLPLPLPVQESFSFINYALLRRLFTDGPQLDTSFLDHAENFFSELIYHSELMEDPQYAHIARNEIIRAIEDKSLMRSEVESTLEGYFSNFLEEGDAQHIAGFYMNLVPNSLFAEPKNKIVNASIDISFEVDPVEFGLDPRKAIQKAVLNQMYAIEGAGEVYDWSIRELYDEGVPFSNEFIMKHGVPTSPNNIEFTLSNELVKQMNPIKE
ncbi:hypothetical protein ACQR3P_29165 [Rhodococcus sp. IEGM1300]